MFSDDFATANGPNNLITNEHAFWSADPLAVRSPNWEMTSGSFFSNNGVGWTGVPNSTAPDADSIPNNGSYVFRLRTVRSDFGNVRQELDARINGFYGFPAQGRPAVAWDGVVIWPRYDTEFRLYFAYILRKDGRIAITKKCPGGDPNDPNYYNGGIYHYLVSEFDYAPTVLGQWYRIGASARDNANGSVTIKLYRAGNVVAQATDAGAGCAPIHGPAKLGLRADNVDASFSHYSVTAEP